MAIYTISDRYGFRGPSRPLDPGDGYRIIYVPSQPIDPDRLLQIGSYIEPAIAPCEFKGAVLDGDELEITVQATSGCAAKTTRWLYDQVVQAVEAFIAEEPIPEPQPEPTPSPSPAGISDWVPLAVVGGILAVAFWMAHR